MPRYEGKKRDETRPPKPANDSPIPMMPSRPKPSRPMPAARMPRQNAPAVNERDQRAANNLNGGRMVYYPPEYRQSLYDQGLIDESFLDQGPQLPYMPRNPGKVNPEDIYLLEAMQRRLRR